MLGQIKKFIIVAAIGGLIYFLLSYHLVFFGREVKLLPKSVMTMNETFVNVEFDDLTTPKVFLRQNPDSRRDGIGPMLVERELITDDELSKVESELDAEQE